MCFLNISVLHCGSDITWSWSIFKMWVCILKCESLPQHIFTGASVMWLSWILTTHVLGESLWVNASEFIDISWAHVALSKFRLVSPLPISAKERDWDITTGAEQRSLVTMETINASLAMENSPGATELGALAVQSEVLINRHNICVCGWFSADTADSPQLSLSQMFVVFESHYCTCMLS